MKYLVDPLGHDNTDVTPDGDCGELTCTTVVCGILRCSIYCDCLSIVAEPWGNGESLF